MATKPAPARPSRPAPNLPSKGRFNWVREWGKSGFLVRGRGRNAYTRPHTRFLKFTLLNFIILLP